MQALFQLTVTWNRPECLYLGMIFHRFTWIEDRCILHRTCASLVSDRVAIRVHLVDVQLLRTGSRGVLGVVALELSLGFEDLEGVLRTRDEAFTLEFVLRVEGVDVGSFTPSHLHRDIRLLRECDALELLFPGSTAREDPLCEK